MKKFHESLESSAMKITNFENNNMIPLKRKSINHILVKETVIFAKNGLKINTLIIRSIKKLKTVVIIQADTEVIRLEYII